MRLGLQFRSYFGRDSAHFSKAGRVCTSLYFVGISELGITIAGAGTGSMDLGSISNIAIGLMVDLEGGTIQANRRVFEGSRLAKDAGHGSEKTPARNA